MIKATTFKNDDDSIIHPILSMLMAVDIYRNDLCNEYSLFSNRAT